MAHKIVINEKPKWNSTEKWTKPWRGHRWQTFCWDNQATSQPNYRVNSKWIFDEYSMSATKSRSKWIFDIFSSNRLDPINARQSQTVRLYGCVRICIYCIFSYLHTECANKFSLVFVSFFIICPFIQYSLIGYGPPKILYLSVKCTGKRWYNNNNNTAHLRYENEITNSKTNGISGPTNANKCRTVAA